MNTAKTKLEQTRKDLFVMTCIAAALSGLSILLGIEVLELRDTIDLLMEVGR